VCGVPGNPVPQRNDESRQRSEPVLSFGVFFRLGSSWLFISAALSQGVNAAPKFPTDCTQGATLKAKSQKIDGDDYLKLFRSTVEGAQALEAEKKGLGLDALGRQCLEDKNEILRTLMKRLPPERLSTPEFQLLLADYFDLKGDPTQSRASLNKAVELQTTHAEANYRLARLAAQAQDTDAQLKHLRRVLLELPQSERAKEYFRLAFFDLVEVESPEEVLRLSEAFLKIHPTDADALLARSRAALETRDAVRLSDSLVKLRKNAKTPLQNVALFYLSAELHRLRKEWAASVGDYAAVLRQRGVPAAWTLSSLRGLTEAHLETNNPALARKTAVAGLKIEPRDARLRAFLERALSTRSPGERAGPSDADFQAALKLFPDSREFRKAWLVELLRRDRLDSAEAQLKILTGDGNDTLEPEIWHWNSVLAGRKLVYTQGLIYSQKALDFFRAGNAVKGVKVKDLYLQAALMQRKRGYFDEATKLLQEGLTKVTDREDKIEIERQLQKR